MALLIFDLDGTLIDSKLDLVNAVNATRIEMRRSPLPPDVISSYVGNGAPVLIRRAMGPDATEGEVTDALAFFLAYYRDHAVDHTLLYPGVRDALDLFKTSGMMLAVLTNKPVRISKAIVDHLGIGSMMFQVYGGNSFEHKKPHPIGIDTLRMETGSAAADTWMIGDSHVDMETGRNAGVRCCGVTYGFQPESLDRFPPDVLVDNLRDFAGKIL